MYGMYVFGSTYYNVKDIVQPKKKEGEMKRDANGFAVTSYSIADVFSRYTVLKGLLSRFNFQKPVKPFRAKKGGVFFYVECAAKNSEAY